MDDRRETLNGRIPWFSLHWARSKEFFEGEPRILSVRKCSKPTFTYVETDAYVQMAFNIIKSKRILYNVVEVLSGLLLTLST